MVNFKKLITSKPKLIFSLASLVFFGFILLLTFTNAFKLLNLKSFDLLHHSINRFQYKKSLVTPLPNVLIINIDSEFIKSLKTYPIPRKYYGFILKSLENSNVLATGLSVIFTEDLCNKALLPFLNKKIVTGSLIYKNNHIECTDEINKKTSSGFLNADLDIDGSLRRILLRKKTNSKIYNHFIIELIKQAYPKINLETQKDELIIDYSKKILNKITQISYIDFYNEYYLKDKVNDLENYFVIIGIDSKNISYYYNTSSLNLSSNYILAASLLTYLNNNFLSENSTFIDMIFICLSAIIIFLFLLKNLNICNSIFFIKFIILLSLIFITPLLLFYILSINLSFFSIYFFLIIFPLFLIIIKYFLNIKELNYTLSINNADLKEKINEIEELNEIRIKAFSDISKLKTEIRKQKNNLFSFTSNLSHQLKNPLSAVIMGTDYLKIKGKQSSNDVLQKQINIIHLSSQRILDIINKIKVLNTLERNNFSEKKELIRINDFLKLIEEFSSNNPLCYELGVELNLKIKSSFNNENAMFGDKELLTEMFDNIVSNSIKYSGNTCKCKILIKADKFQDNNVKFIIEDFGIGIKDKNETAVIERHFRENSNIDGDGLGLNIVQSIVDYHKGIMKIINKGADKGIIIEIIMPILYEKKLK